MTTPLRTLLVEDSELDARLLVERLRGFGYDVVHERVQTAPAMRAALLRAEWDVIFSDYSMPHFDGRGALAVLAESGLDLPLIVISATIEEEAAVEALHAGAIDFLVKGRLTRLGTTVERALAERAARVARREAEEALRRTEEQLRQIQKMDAIGQLAGGIAHDFNNLLSVILTYGQVLLEELAPESPMREPVEEIKKAGDRAAALTRQLLAFSRRQVLDPTVADLNEVVAGMDRMLRRLIGENIVLSARPASDLRPTAVDVGQMEQVLMNLVVNARDAMPEGGTITVETANVELDASYAERHPGVAAGPHVMMAVTDTGVGMDQATQARIFEPFFTTKKRGRGTGLGLSTVFGIVKQSGGHICLDSQPGRGSTFKVYLPCVAEENVRVMPATAAATAIKGSETILVVEDDEAVRALIWRVLTKLGYRILQPRDVEEAVELCEWHEGPIELLLTDVVMPGMSGRQLAQKLREIRPEMKVLYTSGYTDDAMLNRDVLEAGASFLQKPLTPDALSQRVRAVLAGAR